VNIEYRALDSIQFTIDAEDACEAAFVVVTTIEATLSLYLAGDDAGSGRGHAGRPR
jgi:hypothetical protein